jgi:phage terminase small subunit
MPRGGARPGAGRPRKKAAKALAEVRVLNAEGKDPLGFMLSVMRDPLADPDRRDRMAIAAAVYVHRRAGEEGKKEAAAELATKAAIGRFAVPPAPPKLVFDNSRARS